MGVFAWGLLQWTAFESKIDVSSVMSSVSRIGSRYIMTLTRIMNQNA